MNHWAEEIILTPWEQALEDGESVSLGVDPYGLIGLAKKAVGIDHSY